MDLDNLIKRVTDTHNKYLQEKEAWKIQENNLTNQLNSSNDKLEELSNLLSSKDAQIQELSNKLNDTVKVLDLANNQIEELNNQIEELNKHSTSTYNLNLEKEKGWNIREKQLLDDFNSFKHKTYLTVKHLVENVIEPLSEQHENELNESEQNKSFSLKYAEDELKELIKTNEKPLIITNNSKVKLIKVK
jgi:chromosome segregation ATPase